uniref:Uncharacterized protein n=1 Tax=Oryza meridionalis TaxID=40149 RepID=A0A0E0CMX1_9ORYZ
MLGVCMKCMTMHPEASAVATAILDTIRSSICQKVYVLFATSCKLIALHLMYVSSVLIERNQDIPTGLELICIWALHANMTCLQLYSEIFRNHEHWNRWITIHTKARPPAAAAIVANAICGSCRASGGGRVLRGDNQTQDGALLERWISRERRSDGRDASGSAKQRPAMGNSLPVESKFTDEKENDRIKYVVSSMQGWGEKMEDAVSKLAAFCMTKKKDSSAKISY